ncbi:hypothetical protein, partial [Amycolatopsis circi]|uniref:hypothetical protein n=1 Tax=Amycolatopsis circi TaxID=871959 RepID=UPI003CC57B0B
MTAWWGLVGLAGLPGMFALLRARASGGDPLARYPVAREPAVPNADAAHTPLMMPRVTPDMLHHDGGQEAGADSEAESARSAVPRARTGGHDSPAPTANTASVSGPADASAGIRPQAPPSAGRLLRPGAPKDPSPDGSATQPVAAQEPLSSASRPSAAHPESAAPPVPYK